MAKNDNLTDFLTDVADAIRIKKGTSALINPQDFSSEIASISGGGGGTPYVRPSDWLTIPTPDGTTDDIYILNGVIENGLNKVFFQLSGSGTIDWGDGNTETFTNVNAQDFSHQYNYANISSSTWTEHNKARQVLVHISGNRESITKVSFAIPRSYINADSIVVNYNNNISSDIYEIKANISSAYVLCCNNSYNYHRNIEIFDWIGNLTNTSMDQMFYNCYSLQSIPQLYTNNVTNMGQMFNNCYSLQSIPQLYTNNVTNMSQMFNNCYVLQSIPQLYTSKVTNTSGMFQNCYSLQTIPQLNTSNVTNMTSMFQNCYTLQTIPQLNTKNVTNMGNMFYGCYTLQTVPQLNTNSVTSISNMFYRCYALQTIPQLNTSNVTSSSNCFSDCQALQSIKLYNLNPTRTSALTLSNFTNSTMMTKQALVDLFNSLPASPAAARTIQLGSTLQGYLANCYVKDSGNYYTAIIPTSDTSVQTGKTYYTYDENTGVYTQVTPDFTTDTFYYEGVTATWNEYVICESTDTGATLVLTYIANKGYTIT